MYINNIYLICHQIFNKIIKLYEKKIIKINFSATGLLKWYGSIESTLYTVYKITS